MKNLKWILSLFLCVTLTSNGMITGNQLVTWCNTAIKVTNNNGYALNPYDASNEYDANGTCIGYVGAVGDVLILSQKKIICPFSDIPYSQYARIVLKYLENNPDKLNWPAAVLTTLALRQAFPCPSSGK